MAIERFRSAMPTSLSLFLCLVSLVSVSSMAESVDAKANAPPAVDGEQHQRGVYIVYTFTPEGTTPETHHLRTLASVVGGEDAAKDVLLYSYKTAASGFSAKLSKEEADAMSRHPDVHQVVPSRTLQLHAGRSSTMAI